MNAATTTHPSMPSRVHAPFAGLNGRGLKCISGAHWAFSYSFVVVFKRIKGIVINHDITIMVILLAGY